MSIGSFICRQLKKFNPNFAASHNCKEYDILKMKFVPKICHENFE